MRDPRQQGLRACVCGKSVNFLSPPPPPLTPGHPHGGGGGPEAVHGQTLRGHRAPLLLRGGVPHQVRLSREHRSWGGGAPLPPPSSSSVRPVCVPPQELHPAGGLGEAPAGLDQSGPEQHRHRLPGQGRRRRGASPLLTRVSSERSNTFPPPPLCCLPQKLDRKSSTSTGSLDSGGEPKERSLKGESALQKVLALPGNACCCDCGQPDPRWASINLGITLCIQCSGIHR